jgi:hypothetical protein
VLAAASALPAVAQTMKPGLWQVDTTLQSANGQIEQAMALAQKQMEGMAPEQRKRLNEMMAKNGVSLSGNGVSAKVCITKEMAARNDAPIQTQGSCTTQHSAIVSGRMQVSYQCTQPPSHGEGEITFTDDKSYRMNMRATGPQGAAQMVTINGTGRWLGASCGAVKPVSAGP